MAVIVTVSCTGSKKQSIMKREEAKKILVVVDLQRDFIDGTLPAADGASIIPSIEGIKNDFDMVYFTLDWHPWNHCSFKDNGGIWPQHCVQYTIGAGLPDGILDNLDPANTRFLPKGSDRSQEEYGQFSRTVATDQNFFVKGDKVVICGIAAEYCVLETLKNLVRLSNEIGFEISVFLDGVAHIENNTPLEEYMKQNDIKVYK
jgi:nicotinamidase/pyrazinamidase